MRSKRRSFLLNGSAGLFGLAQMSPDLLAQAARAGTPVAHDVVDFWVNQVGVPPELVLGNNVSRGLSPSAIFRTQDESGGSQSAYGREPLFLFVDPDENHLVPAQEIPVQKLLPPSDALVEIKVGRLRLNSDDETRFERFSSGGIYLDFQQKQSAVETASALAWSMFGAVFPRLKGKGATRPALPASLPREAASLQSVALPGGAGKAMFSCFLKDPKRSAFGSFVNTFLELTGKGAPEFLPLLGLPAIAVPALSAVRALVCNLQAHGGNHDWLFQNSPLDLTCTADPAESGALRLRSGTYLAIPKAHAGALKGSLADVKVLDGFLVPKASGLLDVYDAAPEFGRGVSYLSLNVSVKRTKLNNCSTLLPGLK